MKRHDAFTLTQMLVTVAVGSLLTVAILPVLQSDHQTLQRAICASNLREIGVAITMYASDNNDYFPPGYDNNAGSDWHLIITPYLGKRKTTYASGGTTSPAFICPAAPMPPAGSTTSLSYTAHRAMFWPNPAVTLGDLCGATTILPYKLSQCFRPGEVAMVFDGCEYQTSGNTFDAQACSDQLHDSTTRYNCPASAATNDQPEPIGGGGSPNQDIAADAGMIRWRHSNNNGANFLMVDGHVSSLLVGQLLRRNLRYDK
jgi:prepilin-type processing-associated H-X9-DG protein